MRLSNNIGKKKTQDTIIKNFPRKLIESDLVLVFYFTYLHYIYKLDKFVCLFQDDPVLGLAFPTTYGHFSRIRFHLILLLLPCATCRDGY